MRYLGIDYGSKRIGLAFSDEGASIAFPLQTVQNTKKVIDYIKQLIEERAPEGIVMGHPTTAEGENPISDDIRAFAERLEAETGLPVSLESEHFSSVEAARYAPPGSEKDDSAAAAIILQRFLDTRGKKQ